MCSRSCELSLLVWDWNWRGRASELRYQAPNCLFACSDTPASLDTQQRHPPSQPIVWHLNLPQHHPPTPSLTHPAALPGLPQAREGPQLVRLLQAQPQEGHPRLARGPGPGQREEVAHLHDRSKVNQTTIKGWPREPHHACSAVRARVWGRWSVCIAETGPESARSGDRTERKKSGAQSANGDRSSSVADVSLPAVTASTNTLTERSDRPSLPLPTSSSILTRPRRRSACWKYGTSRRQVCDQCQHIALDPHFTRTTTAARPCGATLTFYK